MSQTQDADLPGPEWMAFGDAKLKRSLLLVHHKDDAHPDTFRPMDQNMTVFGFARKGTQKYFDVPNHAVSIGFVETDEADMLREAAASWLTKALGSN